MIQPGVYLGFSGSGVDPNDLISLGYKKTKKEIDELCPEVGGCSKVGQYRPPQIPLHHSSGVVIGMGLRDMVQLPTRGP